MFLLKTTINLLWRKPERTKLFTPQESDEFPSWSFWAFCPNTFSSFSSDVCVHQSQLVWTFTGPPSTSGVPQGWVRGLRPAGKSQVSGRPTRSQDCLCPPGRWSWIMTKKVGCLISIISDEKILSGFLKIKPSLCLLMKTHFWLIVAAPAEVPPLVLHVLDKMVHR